MSSGTSTDTWHFFARPWLAALALAWTVGVIDSYSFAEYGVFTSNQAGNLVVLGNELPQDPQRATLAGLSLLGAVAGVAAATVLQRLFAKGPWLKVAVPLVFMVMLMVVGWFLRHVVGSPPETLVPVTSAALAGLAWPWLAIGKRNSLRARSSNSNAQPSALNSSRVRCVA